MKHICFEIRLYFYTHIGKYFNDDAVFGFNGNTTAADARTSYASRCSSGRSKVSYGQFFNWMFFINLHDLIIFKSIC